MKKLLSIVLCAATASTLAADETAATEAVLGAVGVTEITSSLQNTIVAVSYDDLAGGSGMVVSNFVKTTNLTEDDQLAIFNNGEGGEIYDTWVLRKNDQGVLYWAKNDKTFYVDANGLREGEGTSASAVTNAVGTGIWLCRKEKPSGSFKFYIYGKPSSATTFTTTAGALMLVGNPKQVQVTVGPTTVTGAEQGDQVVAVDEAGKLCYYTFLNSTKGWCTTKADGSWDFDKHPKLPAGCGCWIRTAKVATINW